MMVAKKKDMPSASRLVAFETYDRLVKAEEGARRAIANLAFLVPTEDKPGSPYRALMSQACELEHALEEARHKAASELVREILSQGDKR